MLRIGSVSSVLLFAVVLGCSDSLVDPRKPPTDAGVSDTLTDSLWDLDSLNTCATNERLCTVEGPPCNPVGDSGLPPSGCGPQPQCFDVMSNNQRCGNCETSCNTETHQCEEGQCVCKIEGAESCGGATCIDLDSTNAHCGDCYRECGLGKNCIRGDCFDAPGDLPFAWTPNDPLAPIEMNFVYSGGAESRQIAINNYGFDPPLPSNNAAQSGSSSGGGADVYFHVSLSTPPVGSDINVGVSVDTPGYYIAIWIGATAQGTPAKDFSGNGYPLASLTICNAAFTHYAVMVRKIYAEPEADGFITVTISASAQNLCLDPP